MLLVLIALIAILVPSATVAAPPGPSTTIQILNVSDWHGNLDPINGVGGAGIISTYWKADRLANPKTLTLTAGDDFGATPPLSGFFDEEPAVRAQRLMGIQVGTLGNHNFDRGTEHLQRMIDLAGTPASTETPGSPFTYVSSDLQNLEGNLTGVAPFRIFDVGGVKVGVVGVTNPEAPGLVTPGNFGTITIANAYASANKAKAAAKRAGAQVVVAITHFGLRGFSNGAPIGELVDFANNVGGFDVIFGDHTDIQYSGIVNGQLVLENRSFGVTYAKTSITVNSKGKVTDRGTTFVSPVAAGVTPDPAIVTMLAPYRTALSAALDEPIGTVTNTFIRRISGDPAANGNYERREETPLGDLVADGVRWKYDVQVGYMTGGGLRQNLPFSGYLPVDTTLRRPSAGYAAGPPFDVVKGDIYSVLPFNNVIVTRTVTGAQLWDVLENGVSQITCSGAGSDGRFPQVSGIKFTFNYNLPAGSRVSGLTLDDGTPVPDDTSTSYSFATTSFTNAGGDSYSMLADGQGVSRDLDAAVMLDYWAANGPNFDPASYPLDRITKLGTPTC
jgi:2',3'-cyclic-nucleotide 2'-phosphodiesterase (5'-nucleotidase family)